MTAAGPRVLLLNWRDINNPLAGGAEVHVWEVFSRLAARGWGVHTLCASYPNASREEIIRGIGVTRIAHPMLYHLALPWAYPRATRRFRPDVVVDFMNKLPLYTPQYVREPLCCFVHHLFGSSAIQEAGWLAGPCIWAYERPVPWLYGKTPFLTGSLSSVEELQGLGIRNVVSAPMPYGVETEQFTPGTKASNPSLLYLGRLKRYKGVDHLIQILPELRGRIPELCLHIAGTGDDRDRLEALAWRLGVAEAVTFHGFVTEEEKRRLYQAAWITCLPSYKEGFGLTIPEAALCGTPTVGYDVPGLRDAITHNGTGLLVPYGDREALSGAILELMSDETRRRALGAAARKRYADFTWDAAADRMEAYLRHRIDEAGTPHG